MPPMLTVAIVVGLVVAAVVVLLLVLGPKRLPGAGRALGQGLKEFRASITGRESEEGS